MMWPRRKPTRLRNYDYSSAGAYFITICTQERRCVLSRIAQGCEEVELTHTGTIVESQIRDIENRFPSVTVDKYVIMPNHVHLILVLHGDIQMDRLQKPASVIDVIRVLKSMTTRLCKSEQSLFQRSFHDHVIRTERDYRMIWDYIDKNPLAWKQDCFYSV